MKKHEDFYPIKGCPHRTLDLGWQRFLNMVNYYMKDKLIDNNIESGSDESVRTHQKIIKWDFVNGLEELSKLYKKESSKSNFYLHHSAQ